MILRLTLTCLCPAILSLVLSDFGSNMVFEGSFYANFNLTCLDAAKVTFGADVLCGPNGKHKRDRTDVQFSDLISPFPSFLPSHSPLQFSPYLRCYSFGLSH